MGNRDVLLQYTILSTITIVGLLLMIVGVHYKNDYINAIADTLMTSGVLGVLYQAIMGKYQDKKMMDLLRVHESVHTAGLLEYHEKDIEFSFAELIRDSASLVVLVRDGLSWCKANADYLRSRFGKNTQTRIYMLDPEGDFAPMIAKRSGYDAAAYVLKLKTAKDELIAAYRDSAHKGELELLKLKTFPAQALYLTDERLVMTLYQTSSKRMNVPLFVYDATDETKCMYRFIRQDLAACLAEAKQYVKCSPDASSPNGYLLHNYDEDTVSGDRKIAPDVSSRSLG